MTTGQFAENQFEQYLIDSKVEYRRISVASEPTPDFEIVLSGRRIVVEVKQIDMNPEDRRVLAEIRAKQPASYWIPNRVRGKLKHVSRQLQAAAISGVPTMVLLCNNVPLHEHGNADEILDAMFGQTTYTVSWPEDRSAPPSVSRVSAGGSRAVTRSQNTSLSAVGVLGRAGSPNRLRIYHNPFARVEMPTALFARVDAKQFTVHHEPESQLPSWREFAPNSSAG
ncbi:MAG: hypothetical protein WEB50_05705 [Vicinamibacterales bacterium]